MRKILSFMAAILFAGAMMATDVEVVIYASSGDCYAKTHEWVQGSSSGPAYEQVVLDDNITANLIGTGNNGKFYSDWRFYTNGSENGSFSIDAAEGYELKSVTFTYTISNQGALFEGENQLKSGEAYEVSGNKVVFQCRNTNTGTNGQVRITKIAVSYDSGSGETPVVYTVAGSSDIAFGTTWDPANTANKMKKQADGSYKWEKEGLELPAGAIEFKVVKDLDWANGAWPDQNYSLPIDESGIYTIVITFEPANENLVSAVATKTGDLVILPTVAMHGNFLGSWADTEHFTLAEDKKSASLSLVLEPGDFEFGMRIGGAGNWTANGVAFTRDNASAEVVAGSGNLTLAADIAGEYVFTWTFETNTLAIKFPKKVLVLPEGAYRLTFTYFDKVDGDGGTKLSTVEAIFDEASQPLVGEVLVGSDVYAGRYYEEDGERINSNLKLGTASRAGELKFTLKEEVEVDSIVFRAAMYSASEGADGFSVNGEAFTLSAGKLIFEDKVWKPEGKVSEIDIVQKTANKGRFFLTSITVFAKQGGVEPPVEEPTFTVAGNLEAVFGTSWDPANAENDMTLVEDGYYTWLREGVELEAGNIEFKVCKNHSWDVAYPQENYVLAVPEAGKYTITIGFNPVTLVVDAALKNEGDVPPVVVDKVQIRLVPGEWNADGAKFAAATLDEIVTGKPSIAMLVNADFSDWFVDEGEGVFVGGIPATAKMVAFGRFKADTETPSIETAMNGQMINNSDVLVIDESMMYIIDGLTGDDPSFSPGHWYSEVPPVNDHTYTVAGSSDAAFGTTWDPTNTSNDMILDNDGIYRWYITDLPLSKGTLKFKVCEDHSWDVAYPAADYELVITEDGIYTIFITFDPTSKEVSAEATKTGDVVIIPTVAMHGNFLGSWADTENFTEAEDHKSASLALKLEAGSYEFGMRVGGSGNWMANGVSFTRENPSAVVVDGQGNLKLEADANGEYLFTWIFESNTLEITFPDNGEVPPVSEWDEIYFKEVDVAGSGATAKSFVSDTNAEFMLSVTDDGSKIAIDENVARFGDPVDYQMFNYRLKTGGKSSSKNVLTLAIPADGQLRIAVRTGSNSATDRTLVLTQGETELYNRVVLESDAELVMENEIEVKVYPFVTVDVKAGNLVIEYPVGGLNFYEFGFKKGDVPPVVEHTYTVAGNEPAVFGTAWDPTNVENDMTLVDDFYTWSRTGIELPVCSLEFKVVEDHSWDIAYPADNYILNIPEAGTYDITIIFDPDTKTVEAVAKKQGGVLPDMAVIRLVPGVWDADGAKFAAVTLNFIPEGEFGIAEVLAQATFSDWFEADQEVEGAYRGSIPADTKIIAFGRFAPETETPNLAAVMSANLWNHSDILFLDASMKYTIDGWPAEGDDVCPGHWGDLLPVEHNYSVVGPLTPGGWDATATDCDMTYQEGEQGEPGAFVFEMDRVQLAAGEYEYKIVEDHSWDICFPAGPNAVLKIEEGGIYNLIFWIRPDVPEFGVLTELVEKIDVIPSVAMHGNFFGSWYDTEEFALAQDNQSASLLLTLEKGVYEFGMRIGGPNNWMSNGAQFTRESPSAEVVSGSGNLGLEADVAGDYVFTWTFGTHTLTVTFPDAPPVGDLVDITLVPGVWNLDGAKFAAATLNFIPVGELNMMELIAQATFSDWFLASESIDEAYVGKIPADTKMIAFGRFAPETETPSLEAVMSANFWNHSDIEFIDASMKYTIDGWAEEGQDYCPGHWGDIVPIIPDGYYLVGSFNNWSPALEYALAPNDQAEVEEYFVTLQLAEGAELKAAYVRNGAIVYYYPDGDNYIVSEADEYNVYFRPNYDGGDDWFGGCLYLAKTSGEGIEEVLLQGKAVKVLRDNQIFILKGDKTFTVTGLQVR